MWNFAVVGYNVAYDKCWLLWYIVYLSLTGYDWLFQISVTFYGFRFKETVVPQNTSLSIFLMFHKI